MFKETLRQKQSSVAGKLLLLFLAVALVIFIECTVLIVNTHFKVPALEFIMYVLLIGGAAWFFFRKMVSFSYSIIDSDVIFDKAVGSRARCIEDVNFDEVVEVGAQIKGNYTDMKKRYFTIRHSAKNAYYIIYKRNEKFYAIMMHPTTKFIDCLEKGYKNHLEKQKASQEG